MLSPVHVLEILDFFLIPMWCSMYLFFYWWYFLCSWFPPQIFWLIMFACFPFVAHIVSKKLLWILLQFNTLTMLSYNLSSTATIICLLFRASSTECCLSITLAHLFPPHLNNSFSFTFFLPVLAYDLILASDLISLTFNLVNPFEIKNCEIVFVTLFKYIAI